MGIKRKFQPQVFIGIAVLHIGSIYTLIRWYNHGFSTTAWITFFCFWLVTSLVGTSIGYHRYFTHQSFKCSKPMQVVMAVVGSMAVQGSILAWVLAHLQHHAFADIPGKDPHTPKEFKGLRGIYWAHMGWSYHKVAIPDNYTPPNRLKDDPIAVWQNRWHWLFVAMSLLLPLGIAGWDGFWLAGIFRILLHLHITWGVNSLGHKWGTRPKDKAGRPFNKDNSRDLPVLGAISSGELGNHGRHHTDARSAFLGRHWYHFDFGGWTIKLLERFGIVWSVISLRKEPVS